jgi:hypothetical protein
MFSNGHENTKYLMSRRSFNEEEIKSQHIQAAMLGSSANRIKIGKRKISRFCPVCSNSASHQTEQNDTFVPQDFKHRSLCSALFVFRKFEVLKSELKEPERREVFGILVIPEL